MSPRGLIADVGGTHVRVAWVDDDGGVRDETLGRCADHDSLGAALAAYVDGHGWDAPPATAAVCVAGPVTDGVAQMTNHPWVVSGTDLTSATGIADVSVINDFQALALAVPHLDGGDVTTLWKGPDGDVAAPCLVLGPGTGLGVAVWTPDAQGGGRAVATEGGHMSLSPRTDDEIAILSTLMARFGHVSVERVVSGPGLETLYEITSGGHDLEAAEVADHARAGEPEAVQAVHHFFAFLGTATADLALAHGARGGIYLAGGMLPKMQDLIAGTPLRSRIVDQGRFSDYVAAIPVHLITHPYPAFVGLAATLGARGASHV